MNVKDIKHVYKNVFFKLKKNGGWVSVSVSKVAFVSCIFFKVSLCVTGHFNEFQNSFIIKY